MVTIGGRSRHPPARMVGEWTGSGFRSVYAGGAGCRPSALGAGRDAEARVRPRRGGDRVVV